MNAFFIAAIVLSWIVIGLGCWLGWQLLRQNGRILLRLDELEKRLDELEFGEPSSSRRKEALTEESEIQDPKSEMDQSLVTSAATNGEGDHRASRFSNRSLSRSRIKRDGLKTGTSAPDFRLPRLDGGELSLEELRGRRVLLVFSDPQCGPCNVLAPMLEKFHRENRTNARSPSRPAPPGEGEPAHPVVVMISRGEPKENRQKVKEHRLTFLIVLQRQREVSRRYAMFATPVAYLIDKAGVIAHEVAVGVEPILRLLVELRRPTEPVAKNSVGDFVAP